MPYDYGGFKVGDRVKFVRFIDNNGAEPDSFSEYMENFVGLKGRITGYLKTDTPCTLIVMTDNFGKFHFCPEELEKINETI